MSELLSYYWILELVANFVLIFLILKLIHFSYAKHSYLYQFDNKKQTVQTWIEFALPLASLFKFSEFRKNIEKKLSQSTSRNNWSSDHFISAMILLALSSSSLLYLLISVIMGKNILWVIGLTSFIIFLPYLKISEMAKKRNALCDRELPYFIDFISLCMGAGQDFNGALTTVVNTTPDNALNREFKLVLKNIQFGMSRTEALANMERRMNVPSIKLFIQTMIQGIELGTDVVRTLEGLSSVFQTKKFQKAEESAGKISVQMMIPMMMFVMPAVMIILLGPMAMQYIQAQ